MLKDFDFKRSFNVLYLYSMCLLRLVVLRGACCSLAFLRDYRSFWHAPKLDPIHNVCNFFVWTTLNFLLIWNFNTVLKDTFFIDNVVYFITYIYKSRHMLTINPTSLLISVKLQSLPFLYFSCVRVIRLITNRKYAFFFIN